MVIQNIQIVQGLFRAAEGKSDSGKGEISAESNPSLPEVTLPEEQVRNLSDKSNVTDIYCPPLFPLGHTQGIYDMIAKSDSSSGDSVEAIKEGIKLDKTAKTEDAAPHQAASDKEGKIANDVSQVKEKISPGSVLDLKI